MVSSAERPPDASAENATQRAAKARSKTSGTPIPIWIVYVFGILGAVIIASSLLFAVVVAAADDSGFDFELSAPFFVWLVLVVVAASAWIIRRFGSPR